MPLHLPKSYHGPVRLIARYWRSYGGWGAFVRSFYLHCSFIVALGTSSILRNINWTELVIHITPNLVGFSLAGYAVVLGFGDDKFKKVLTESISDEGHSAYIEINAAFVNFIIFQVVALGLAIVARSTPFVFIGKVTGIHIATIIPNFIGWYGPITNASWFLFYWIFIYSLSLAIAATLSVFRLACIYDKFISAKETVNPENWQEILKIRNEIAGMPIGDSLRIYFLTRLDLLRGHETVPLGPSVEAARATLEEARSACRK